MEPVSLMVGALAAGGAAGLSDAAKAAVTELYGRVRMWFGSDRDAQRALAEVEGDPSASGALAGVLVRRDVASHAELLGLAERVMALVDPAGAAAGKYVVDASSAKGVQVGDYNTQNNKFS